MRVANFTNFRLVTHRGNDVSSSLRYFAKIAICGGDFNMYLLNESRSFDRQK